MTLASPLSKLPHRAIVLRLPLFTPVMRMLWFAVFTLTIVSEVVYIPLMAYYYFYPYCALKAVCFLLVGYLAPLSFWRFNALNRGILFAAVSSALVEALQLLVPNGHSFHWYELILKLVVILFGFALALDARFEREAAAGPIRIVLGDEAHDVNTFPERRSSNGERRR